MWNVGGWGWLSSLVHSEHTGLILCLYEWLFNHKPSISQYFPKLQSIFHKTEYSIPFTCMYKHLINVKWINPEDRASEKSWTMQPLHLLFYDMSVHTTCSSIFTFCPKFSFTPSPDHQGWFTLLFVSLSKSLSLIHQIGLVLAVSHKRCSYTITSQFLFLWRLMSNPPHETILKSLV